MLSRWVRWILSIAIVCWMSVWVLPSSVFAQTTNAVGDEVPTVQTADGIDADWNRISFASLPRFEAAGEITVPDTVPEGSSDYTMSRSWQAGASPADVLKIGDVGEAFGLNSLTLGQTVPFTNVAPDQLSLSNLQFLPAKTLADLVREVPGLGNVAIDRVKPLFDLVKAATGNPIGKLGQTDQIWSEQPLSVLSQMPEIGNLQIGSLDLSQYSFAQIPGLDQLAIENIAGANNLTLSAIPGLPNIPLSNLPITPGKAMGYIAIHDVTYGGDHEHDESRQTPTKFSITGSNRVGFNYECHQARGCDYLELNSPAAFGALGDSARLHGARWIRGGKGKGEQMVKGGSGILGALNGGVEPTGRHPFGSAFKVVLTDTDESTGSGKFGLYFRVCHHGVVDLGCTPYFIGPIPWFPTHEKGIVIVGLTELPAPDVKQPDTPDDVQNIIDQYDPSENGLDTSGDCIQKAISAAPESDREYAKIAIPLLINAARAAGITDPRQVAYILATAQAETNFHSRTNEAGARGYVQIIGEWNYIYWGNRLGIDLIHNPDLANRPDIAAKIAAIGMKEGIFTGLNPNGTPTGTGQKLSDYINGSKADYVGARSIIYAGDRAGEIAGYARKYAEALADCGSVSKDGWCDPAPGAVESSPFGQYPHGNHVHAGSDLAANFGTPVRAARDGRITRLGQGYGGGYGLFVEIQHDNGFVTLYGHNEQQLVQVGQQVQCGSVIAKMGSTGHSTGPHSHFELTQGSTTNAIFPGKYVPHSPGGFSAVCANNFSVGAYCGH